MANRTTVFKGTHKGHDYKIMKTYGMSYSAHVKGTTKGYKAIGENMTYSEALSAVSSYIEAHAE